MREASKAGRKPLTFLGRLARDVRGNTLAIMAAALIPLAGMVGGGIDISRMYITKTRLQHACDAGALAGRKSMGGGVWGTDDQGVADQFFAANYATGSYGSTNLTHAYAESAGKVTGTASAVLPMTLIRVLGFTTETLAVTCDAEMRLPNTDIMFVLDTTGSMAQKAVSTDTDTKIVGLKKAVKCFYEIVAKLDTDATCSTGTPSGGTGSQVQIRFGFMPYSTNVNVGHLLPPSYFADSWKYQSREPVWYSGWTQTSSTSSNSTGSAATTQSQCTTQNANAIYGSHNDTNDGVNRTVVDVSAVVTGYSNGVCYGTVTTKTTKYTLFKQWHYGQINVNISGLKNGSSWNSGLSLPIGAGGYPQNVSWDGCIEERPTVRQSSYSPIPSGAYDLNIDLVPTGGNANSLWGPALNQVIYDRAITSSYSQASTADAYTTADYYNGLQYYCPTEAKKLQAWPDPTAFDSYVDSLTPSGNTYHDIGMLWGARFISPTGIFASENATTPQGGQIDRHIIFMTDGDAQSAPCDYAAYGVAWYDQRTTTDVGTAGNCGNERTALDDQVNARLVALCTAVKNMNITLWVISFGSGTNTTTETRLSNCATPGRYFQAKDSATLQATFASIADQISQLRLTQ